MPDPKGNNFTLAVLHNPFHFQILPSTLQPPLNATTQPTLSRRHQVGTRQGRQRAVTVGCGGRRDGWVRPNNALLKFVCQTRLDSEPQSRCAPLCMYVCIVPTTREVGCECRSRSDLSPPTRSEILQINNNSTNNIHPTSHIEVHPRPEIWPATYRVPNHAW
jgi:hypothetical protein